MTTEEAINYYGGKRKALADALGLWPHSIYRWGTYPPVGMQARLEIITNGALKAERDQLNKGLGANHNT
jgi:hypothetical protein